MLLATRRVLFTLQTESRYAVAKATGMSWSTVNRVLRGVTEVPRKYWDAVRPAYQRAAYSSLRNTGFSATQARRFSWYRPQKVTGVNQILTDKVKFLTKGFLGDVAQRRGLTFEEVNTPYYRKLAKDAITEGLKKSLKTFEEWEQYGLEK